MYDWLRDPFFASATVPENFILKEEEELCELQSDCTLKMKFSDLPMDKFWISVKEEYPNIHQKTLNILLPFSASYMYKQASKARKEIDSTLFRMNSVCACPNYVQEYSICTAKNKHRFHIKEGKTRKDPTADSLLVKKSKLVDSPRVQVLFCS